MKQLLFLFLFLFGSIFLAAQVSDSTTHSISRKKKGDDIEVFSLNAKPKYKNPWIAGGMSLVLPGAGQFYVNAKKYWWKGVAFPIGIGLLGLAIDFNEKRYQTFRLGYNLFSSSDKTARDTLAQYVDPLLRDYFRYGDSSILQRARDFYLSQRDFWIVFTAVAWIVNVLDAVVYAHLSGFNVGKNTTLFIRPKFPNLSGLLTQTDYGGISFVLNF